MGEAIETLRSKGHIITHEEAESVSIAILLHDIGHGPFSHALEDSIVPGIKHEEISGLFMDQLNSDFQGELSMAIEIFNDRYPKRFLHQLVSGQLDVDRLDYLTRDSFFTGVSEGVISHDRIIKMLEICGDELAIEEKGIYSIEKFIVARRLMYWQVYLHKTVVCAEQLLISILRRAKELRRLGTSLFSTPALATFLDRVYTKSDFLNDKSLLATFAELDDSDITTSVKQWSKHPDFILSELCRRMMNRQLFKIILQRDKFDETIIQSERDRVIQEYNLKKDEIDYFVLNGTLVNNAYDTRNDKINILLKNGKVLDIADAADTLNIKSISGPIEKYYLSFPKKVRE